MTERPILFSGEMVRAILEGRKTQTRRVVKDQHLINAFDFLAGSPEEPCCGAPRVDFVENQKRINDDQKEYQYTGLLAACDEYPEEGFCEIKCPYGQPGDRLWVRETWQAVRFEKDFETGIVDDWRHAKHIPKLSNGYWSVCYEADKNKWSKDSEDRGFPWRPSIHMPRWASRLTLEITNVKVERLNDISEEDSEAEGVYHGHLDDLGQRFKTYKRGFQTLWESMNGPGSWEMNPWVWAVGFKVVKNGS